MKRCSLVAFVLLTSLCLSISVSAQQTISKSFSGIKKVRITTSSGNCSLKKSADNTVGVTLTHTFDKEFYEPRIEQDGDRLTIKENFNGKNIKGRADWSINIPDGLSVDFVTGSGDLEGSDLSLTLKATAGSGDLTFHSVKGTIGITTGSGNIELLAFDGEIKGNTGSGDIRVENSKGDIDLNCGSGNIRIMDTQASLSINTGSGDISAKKIQLAGSSKFNTGSGDVGVVLAATPSFDLSVNSGSGDATLNFGGNEIRGEIVMRASKKHGRIVAPFEFDKVEETDEWGDNVVIRKTVVKGDGKNRITIGTGSGTASIEK